MSFFVAIPTPTLLFLDLLGGGFYSFVLLLVEEFLFLFEWLGWFVYFRFFLKLLSFPFLGFEFLFWLSWFNVTTRLAWIV